MENRSHTLLGLSQFVHRYFLWVLIGAYAVAAVLPAPGLWIRDVRLGDMMVPDPAHGFVVDDRQGR